MKNRGEQIYRGERKDREGSSQIDTNGRRIFTADAHRDDGKRFIVH